MSAPVREGEVLAGKYLVERVVGAGGMGVVVAARHVHLDERVALKFLLPEALAEPVTVTRFLREGRAASKIRSEHVARVHDVGTLETGAPYIVMEFLEGSDLAALVKARGPLDVPTAVEYILQACEAIAEAHSIGIVHRDIKPSNLFVATRPDGSPVVKVIDFGISKVGTGVDAGMEITKTAEMRGSMLFMSPEQMSSPRSVDPRSDIWSLGVSLHHLLTGAYPFQATSMPELCATILQRAPVPLSAARPGAPQGLEACILRSLRKNPEERYANVAEFAVDLAHFAPGSARLSVERICRLVGAPRLGRGSLPSLVPEEPRAPALTAGVDTTVTVPIVPPTNSSSAVEAGDVSSTSLNRGVVTTGAVGSTSASVRTRKGSLLRSALVTVLLASTVTTGVAVVALRYVHEEAAVESGAGTSVPAMSAPGVLTGADPGSAVTVSPAAMNSASSLESAPLREASVSQNSQTPPSSSIRSAPVPSPKAPKRMNEVARSQPTASVHTPLAPPSAPPPVSTQIPTPPAQKTEKKPGLIF